MYISRSDNQKSRKIMKVYNYLKKGGLTDEEIADIETYLTGK